MLVLSAAVLVLVLDETSSIVLRPKRWTVERSTTMAPSTLLHRRCGAKKITNRTISSPITKKQMADFDFIFREDKGDLANWYQIALKTMKATSDATP